ncbi:uncharacterized protein [Prorops nasuta]|uniref:uncharacterized protein n=1 Tax=Prorops nasuta TaxID=863751 RepID=UPI0034CFF0E6
MSLGKMKALRGLFVVFVISAACTCGVRGTTGAECGSRAVISVLTSIHDDPSCRKLSTRGVLLAEAAKLIADIQNNKSNGFDIDVTVLDTCGSITGALKAAMKALVLADINCLQPPHFLGIVGPDTLTNAEAVHKITSVLKVPHIIRKSSNSPFLHYLPKESDSYLVQGAIKVIQTLKWKSFTLSVNTDEDNEDDAQNIAKKLTQAAIAKNLCVLVYDEDEGEYTDQVIHIGKLTPEILKASSNATILVLSEGNLENHIIKGNSNNTILLLEDSRNEFVGLESRVEKSKWWNGNQGVGKYDAEELREVRWLEDAVRVYAKALDTTCKKKKCKNPINSSDWNNAIRNVVSSHNAEVQSSPRSLSLSMKTKGRKLEEIGSVTVRKNSAKILWKGREVDDDDKDDEDDGDNDVMPESVRRIMAREKKGSKSGCATTTKEIKMLHDKDGNDDDDDDDDDKETSHVVVSELDDSEWWTMVCTVGGVGVAMFIVGILAVYVLYSNIRGPRQPKGRFVRDNSSLRRTGSDREIPISNIQPRPAPRAPQRRDSNRSVHSNISEKSV